MSFNLIPKYYTLYPEVHCSQYLYKRLYKAELFSSSLTVRMNERDDFYKYSRQHQHMFKIAMMELE